MIPLQSHYYPTRVPIFSCAVVIVTISTNPRLTLPVPGRQIGRLGFTACRVLSRAPQAAPAPAPPPPVLAPLPRHPPVAPVHLG